MLLLLSNLSFWLGVCVKIAGYGGSFPRGQLKLSLPWGSGLGDAG